MRQKCGRLHCLHILIGAALLVAPLSLSVAGSVAAAGPRCYVNDDAGGANDGTSWGDAYVDLQAALADTNCTEIWVAAGTYKPTTGGNRGFSFVLKNGVAIYGGFAGTETQIEQRDWVANVTTLSGDLNGDDVGFTNNGDNSRIVVRGENDTDSTAVLDGFTIRGGNADACGDCRGGGMRNDHSSPTLANLIFTFNTSSNGGGGMYNTYSNPALISVTFTSNTTADGYSGGGMYNYNSNPTLTDVTFSSNTATGGGGMGNTGSSPTLTSVTFSGNTVTGDGGGMYNYNSNPTLTDVTFSGNTADQAGGGMRNGASSPSLTNVTFDTNMAGANGGGMENDGTSSNPTLTNVTFIGNEANQGGGIYNSEGSPVLTDVTFDGNTAIEGGGGIANIDGSPTLTNVTFSGNIADAPDPQVSAGGGMANYNTYSNRSPTLTNVTFSGNSADYGGGLLNYHYSSPVLTNVTFSGNTATSGGGIYNYFHSSPTITNVILWGDGTEVDSENNSAAVIKNSVVQGGCPTSATCTSIVTGDPLLGPLTDNGGLTQTMALLPGSSAIDAGDDASCPVDDQRGVERPQGAHCDIGAYEALLTSTLVSPPNGADTHTNCPNFQWNAFAGATQYLIQISTFSDFSSKVTKATIKKAPLTSYTPKKNLLPNTTYYWRVAAKVGKTYGPWSETWSFTTGNPPPIPKLSAPGNKKSVAGPSPLFDWKDVKTIAGVTFDHYEIQISTDANFATIFDTGYPTLSQYNGFVLPPGTYYWRVRSVADNGDYSAWSKVRIVILQ